MELQSALKFGQGGWLLFEYDNRFGEDLSGGQDGLLHLRYTWVDRKWSFSATTSYIE